MSKARLWTVKIPPLYLLTLRFCSSHSVSQLSPCVVPYISCWTLVALFYFVKIALWKKRLKTPVIKGQKYIFVLCRNVDLLWVIMLNYNQYYLWLIVINPLQSVQASNCNVAPNLQMAPTIWRWTQLRAWGPARCSPSTPESWSSSTAAQTRTHPTATSGSPRVTIPLRSSPSALAWRWCSTSWPRLKSTCAGPLTTWHRNRTRPSSLWWWPA